MKKLFFIFFTILVTFTFGANRIERLSQKLITNNSTDLSKVTHFYEWIGEKIKYDLKGKEKVRLEIYKPTKIIRRKKALAEEYALLFQALCKAQNIPCILMYGYSRDPFFLLDKSYTYANHVWNVVLIDDQWELVDLTKSTGVLITRNRKIQNYLYKKWDIPYVKNRFVYKQQKNDDFFCADPTFFIQHNFPVHNQWQFLTDSIAYQTFCGGIDSIQYFLNKNHIQAAPAKSYHHQEFVQKDNLLQKVDLASKSYQENPKNRSFIGQAYGEHGQSLLQQSIGIQDTLQKIEWLKNAQFYLKESNRLLKGTKITYTLLHNIQRKHNQKRSRKIKISNKKYSQRSSKELRTGDIVKGQKSRSIGRLSSSIRRSNHVNAKRYRLKKQRNIEEDKVKRFIARYEERIKSNNAHIASMNDTVTAIGHVLVPMYDSLYNCLERLEKYQLEQNKLFKKRLELNMNLGHIDSVYFFNQEIDKAYDKVKIRYKLFKYYHKKYVFEKIMLRHKKLTQMEKLLKKNYSYMDKIEQKGNLNKQLKRENEAFKKVIATKKTLRLRGVIKKHKLILEKIENEKQVLTVRKKILKNERIVEYKRFEQAREKEFNRHRTYLNQIISQLNQQKEYEKGVITKISQLKRTYKEAHPQVKI